MHCYRADDMSNMLDVAEEFGFKIAAFHHGVEAYKIADRLAEGGVCGALWAELVGLQDGGLRRHPGEPRDGRLSRGRLRHGALGFLRRHSASESGVGQVEWRMRVASVLVIAPERAIRWLTANAAEALGLSDRIGTLAAGMNADVVVWNRDPFSVYSLAGAGVHRRRLGSSTDRSRAPPARSDFMLGQDANEELR